jgi:hypothetical protein
MNIAIIENEDMKISNFNDIFKDVPDHNNMELFSDLNGLGLATIPTQNVE